MGELHNFVLAYRVANRGEIIIDRPGCGHCSNSFCTNTQILEN